MWKNKTPDFQTMQSSIPNFGNILWSKTDYSLLYLVIINNYIISRISKYKEIGFKILKKLKYLKINLLRCTNFYCFSFQSIPHVIVKKTQKH